MAEDGGGIFCCSKDVAVSPCVLLRRRLAAMALAKAKTVQQDKLYAWTEQGIDMKFWKATVLLAADPKVRWLVQRCSSYC